MGVRSLGSACRCDTLQAAMIESGPLRPRPFNPASGFARSLDWRSRWTPCSRRCSHASRSSTNSTMRCAPARDVEAIFAFLRRLGREYDVSPVLIGEVAIYDNVNATTEMASRFQALPIPRWRYGEPYLALIDTLEAALPLAQLSDLWQETPRPPCVRIVGRSDRRNSSRSRRSRPCWRSTAASNGSRRERSTRSIARLCRSAGARRCERSCCRPSMRRHAGPAIEVQPRLTTLVPERWPVTVIPAHDELLLSAYI